ncbi:DNA helicase RecQ [Bernardetia sp.]|uniref:DNA helicase RecQ n=1 Tax=Bernardetia sp. TaxID=1937974 RepID=UPI0025BC093C|nr:DNA helicase RecQ [Bernardetia sp.]
MVEQKVNLKKTLKEVFGYNQFRGNQETIIQNLLDGKNTFVIMPTGAGKSLCYQLPAIVQGGTAIVISPLIALMKNQVDQLNAVGVNASFLNSTLSKSESNKVKKSVLAGDTKLLYVAPESLTKQENLDFLAKANISFIAIDEAHCISEWGHDFRPEYRRIRFIVDELGDLPIIALTATATPKVQQDIQKNLHMEDANVFKTSFNRQNLYYEVRPKKNVKKQLIKYLKGKKGQSGIIYCLSRKKVEEINEFLNVNDIKSRPYHAGLDSSVRMQNQDAFLNEEADVIVATIAFGMGIDKPDVRFVIHYDAPKSLEGYYQETGRAGRDGLNADCIMFYSPEDIHKLEKFNKDKPVTERDNARHLLQEMMDYATSGVCRRRQLLHYFGENVEKDGGFNDNTDNPKPKFEANEHIEWVLKAVKETEERFTISHIADVLMGTETDYVKSYSHDKVSVFGKGKNQTVLYWRSVIRQVLLFNFLSKDFEHHGVVKLNEKGIDFLENPKKYKILLTEDHDFSKITAEDEEKDIGGSTQNKGHDPVLFDLLKKLRKKIAKERGFPPYVIFQDPSLEEIATVYPTTKDELAQINGVGMAKVEKFGKAFLEAINKYVEENEIETNSEVLVKQTANKSKVKIFIIQQIDRMIDLEEIAEAKGMKVAELISEIEHICYSGTKLNLDYYIDNIMDYDRQDEIYEYFMEAETDSITAAMEEFEDEYGEDELRLMRIKFLSEYAM